MRVWPAMLLALCATPAWAQSLSIERSDYVVGSTITVGFAGVADTARARVLLTRASDGTQIDAAPLGDVIGGQVQLKAPSDPGLFALRLVGSDGTVLAEATFATVVTPAPGALTIESGRVTVGESVTVTVAMPPDRYASHPWVGLFRTGRHVPGGASAGDALIDRQEVRDGTLTFTAPETPGLYDLRLFDRTGFRYLIDAVALSVEATPAPGAIALPQRAYTVGAPMDVTVTLPPDRFYRYPWIGLFAAARGGGDTAPRDRVLIARERLDPAEPKTTVALTAPALPGDYELRLYDRDGTSLMIDRVPFAVEVPTEPDALSLESTTFTVGAPIALTVRLPADRYSSYPSVGLFEPSTRVPGGAATAERRLEWHRLADADAEGILAFTAPDHPGVYALRLFDRDDGFILDELSIDVGAPPAPGTLVLDRPVHVTGEPVAVSVTLPPDRFYSYAWVGLFRPGMTDAGGAGADEERLEWYRVEPGTAGALSFTAPDQPGKYVFRVYDRQDDGYVLDTVPLTVLAAAPADLLTVEGRVFAPGQPIAAVASSLSGRYASYPAVALVAVGHVAPGGALVAEEQVDRERIEPSGGGVTFTAPDTPGPYEVRLYDRDGADYVLAAIPIAVRDPGATAAAPVIVPFTPQPNGPDVPAPRPVAE